MPVQKSYGKEVPSVKEHGDDRRFCAFVQTFLVSRVALHAARQLYIDFMVVLAAPMIEDVLLE